MQDKPKIMTAIMSSIMVKPPRDKNGGRRTSAVIFCLP
jgi:hypothetical protein